MRSEQAFYLYILAQVLELLGVLTVGSNES